ncbi:MAG: RES family NAD+ phosphorylase [Ilumatobacteraceae bacterium]
MTRFSTSYLPLGGVWRIVHKTKDLQQLGRVHYSTIRGGNRFDSISGRFGTLYFGTTIEVCFAEILARLRSTALLNAIAKEEWRLNNWIESGNITADWRHRRIAIRAKIDNELPFVDIDHPVTLAELNSHHELMERLSRYGVNELDLGIVTAKDRRLTRCIAEYLYSMNDTHGQPLWNGIRYMSRHGEGRECWAVFDHAPLRELERMSIERSHPELLKVAALYGLTIL